MRDGYDCDRQRQERAGAVKRGSNLKGYLRERYDWESSVGATSKRPQMPGKRFQLYSVDNGRPLEVFEQGEMHAITAVYLV